jgi:hypothetical protein
MYFMAIKAYFGACFLPLFWCRSGTGYFSHRLINGVFLKKKITVKSQFIPDENPTRDE